jgi:hypothetical protein
VGWANWSPCTIACAPRAAGSCSATSGVMVFEVFDLTRLTELAADALEEEKDETR